MLTAIRQDLKTATMAMSLVFALLICAMQQASAGSTADVGVAEWLVKEGARAYYSVYGEWPEHWADVINAGLVQVPVISMGGQELDPDDGTWDFEWDIQYLPPQNGEVPKTATITNINGMQIDYQPISPVLSYVERFGSDDDPRVRTAVNDELRRKHWAIGSVLQHSLLLHWMVYGSGPATFEDYVSSGVTGIDACSINPLTGENFYGDGRPNDFVFLVAVDDESGEATGNGIYATDDTGDTPWNFSY